MTAEIDLFRLIVRTMLGIREQKIWHLLSAGSIDWKKFKELITYHNITPFVYLALRDFDSFLPHDLKELLRNDYYCSLVHAQGIWHEFLKISTAFEQKEIVLVPIKGTAFLGDIYTQMPVRPMIDMDLLVEERQLLKAESILNDLGYGKKLHGHKEEYWRNSQCHLIFGKKQPPKGPCIELHWGIDFKRRGRVILPELWSRIRKVNAAGRVIKLLSPEDTLFSLSLHNRRYGRTLCLKNVCDLILVLYKYGHDFDWGYVLEQSRKYDLCATVFFILQQARLLSEVPLPPSLEKDLKISAWKKKLIQQFIEKNTFLLNKKMSNKDFYLRSHFLLYDSFWEPIDYIIHIPKESS